MSDGLVDLLRRLEPALAAAVITPGLRSILLLDASRSSIEAVADVLEQMLVTATDRSPVRRYLNGAQQEDDLWARPDLWSQDGSLTIRLRSGVLMEDREAATVPLIVAPNIAEGSLAAARACVTLMGSEVGQMERHGASLHWRPDMYWLGACDRAQIGKVSRHLLDRFAVRLDARRPSSFADRTRDIRRWTL